MTTFLAGVEGPSFVRKFSGSWPTPPGGQGLDRAIASLCGEVPDAVKSSTSRVQTTLSLIKNLKIEKLLEMDHSALIIRGLESLLWEQNYNHHTLLQGIIYKLYNYKKFVASSQITTPFAPPEENCISVSTQKEEEILV
jgi:hypothetical protein